MPGTKEQMNVQIAAVTKRLAKTCATVRQTSLNDWVEMAIREQAARDNKRFKLDAMNKELAKVASRYLPGKVATPAEMLAMAQRVAIEDTEEGFEVSHVAPRRAPATTRVRKKRRG